jgi:hypothetical protein
MLHTSLLKAVMPRLLLALLTATLAAALAVAPARAQFEPEEPEAPAEGEAAAGPAEDDVALTEAAIGDPLVAAALDLPRDTPADRLRVIVALVDVGHPEAAALLLPGLLATELDDAARADLVREVGAAKLFRLIELDVPGPEGAASPLPGARAFAQQALDAASALERDPARIAALIEQLNAASPEERYAARVDLRATGQPGMEAALAALAAATTPEARGNLMAALADMRPSVDAPLIAMLAEAQGQARADAATLAGKLRIRAALPYLASLAVATGDPASPAAQAAIAVLGLPPATPPEAQALLRHELAELDAAPLDDYADIQETWWSWDAAANRAVAAQFPPRQIRVLSQARLAQVLAEAGDARPADDQLALVDALESAELLGRPLPARWQQQLAALTPQQLSSALDAAVDAERFAAAPRLATEIGARGDSGVLATADGLPSPLADAVFSPERAVRFAALAAVMKLNPQRSFPGASHVPAALWQFAAGGGPASAIVAAPNVPRGSDWAGQFRRLGYESTPARTGREALIAAFSPDSAPRLAVVLLDSDLSYPPLREVVYQLRSSALTAGVPILIAASETGLADAQRIAAGDPLTRAVPRPIGQDEFDGDVAATLALNPRPLADAATRNAQASQALEWIAQLLAAKAPYDELRRDGALVNRTVFVPDLAAASIRVLAELGTADSQSMLADYASARTATIETRRQAAEALAASIARVGIQLTTNQILNQYDRYNASETADADTQAVLASVLDALERKK